MGKTAWEIINNIFQKIVRLAIFFIGLIIFLIAVYMYFQECYGNCQCLLLMLIICLLKNWKSSMKSE